MRVPMVLALALTAASVTSASAQTRQASTESLIYDLKNPDAPRRLDAARDLGLAKTVSAIPALLPLAEDPDSQVRRQVGVTLEQMNDITVLPGLVRLTADGEPDIRERSVQALVNLHLSRPAGPTAALVKLGSLINPWSDQHAETIVEPDVPVDASVVTALRARMADSEDRIRRDASHGLGILRGEAAIPELLLAIGQDRDPLVRFEAVRALRKIGDASTGDRLCRCSTSTWTASAAGHATLGMLKYPGAVPELTRICEESNRPIGPARLRCRRSPISAIRRRGRCSWAPRTTGPYHSPLCERGTGATGRSIVGTVMSADRLVERTRVQSAQAFDCCESAPGIHGGAGPALGKPARGAGQIPA